MKKLFAITIIGSLLFFGLTSEKKLRNKQEEYVCTPCGSDCDNKIYKE